MNKPLWLIRQRLNIYLALLTLDIVSENERINEFEQGIIREGIDDNSKSNRLVRPS